MSVQVSNEQYIEHEVQLRVHEERFRIIESKLNWIITICVGGWIIPIALHSLSLI